MSNEWKELKIDNLSDCPDILTGDYEFEERNGIGNYGSTTTQICEIFSLMVHNRGSFRYRKPEPKAPTHIDIMTIDRYWRGLDDDNNMVWERVTAYLEEKKLYYIHDDWKERDYFSGRSFEDGIPPEVFE